MADLLRKNAPYDSREACSCPKCKSGPDSRRARRRARRRETIDWQQDVERGDYSTEPHTPDLSDGDLDHAWGGLADYMNTPPGQREPWHGYLIPHGPITLDTWERRERFNARLRKIRQERRNG